MQIKINSELTAIRKASKITSKQVLKWAKLEEAWMIHTVERNQPEKQISQTSQCRYWQMYPPTPKMSSIWQEIQ